jgi:hypothetical protein
LKRLRALIFMMVLRFEQDVRKPPTNPARSFQSRRLARLNPTSGP